jgi:alpha-amylase/alpha-mannosidase (GH57 family)
MDNISVALFWHFHQPMYSKPDDPVLPLPWVRLHCLKDYLDMLKHVQTYPDIHVTFNITPSLLMQIDDYVTGKSTDRQYVLFQKKAEALTPEEKTEILRDFFLAHWERMIETNPRYFSLLLKRGKNIVEEELPAIAQTFTSDEFRDLQVCANLVWIDPLFRDEIKDLYDKGKKYTEDDKTRVTEVQKKILSSIVAEYKEAAHSGQIEITTSPLYHPILPLLIDSNLATVSNPNLSLPFAFIHPEDARAQIAKGIATFEKFFSQRPRGIWPSEGSVCEALVPLLQEHGIEWMASDEEILALSLGTSLYRNSGGVPSRPDLMYKPWQFKDVKIVFRDHMLSDLIGFVYNGWDQKKAAHDFVSRLTHISSSLPTFDKFIIPVILDGENAWESYENDGTVFLDTLYKTLTDKHVPTTTISEFLDHNKSTSRLNKLFPGSWIGANFNIWIGHEEDQRGWQIVNNIRDLLVNKNITDETVWERLYILEGSDWYWWFGREHFSVVAEVFDELFRLNAVWIYKQIGEEPPPVLFSPIKELSDAITFQPNDTMTPTIDGEITHFYEWHHAGHAEVKRMGGTMHRSSTLFSVIYCGFDEKNLYIRFDIDNHDILAYEYHIKFYQPDDREITLGTHEGIDFKIKNIGEAVIPFSLFDADFNEVHFIISAHEKGKEVDRTPLLSFVTRLRDVKLHNWTV